MATSTRAHPHLLLQLLQFLKPYKLRLFLAAIALVVAASGVLLLGQGLRLVIDRGFASGDAQWLNWALMGTLGVVAVMALASASRFYLVSWIGERLAADLRSKVFNHLLSLSCSSNRFHRATKEKNLCNFTQRLFNYNGTSTLASFYTLATRMNFMYKSELKPSRSWALQSLT